MTSADDRDGPDRADDTQLRQLRAVWLSMRDEEPSDRGLSALLTAARSQADHMRPRERWWQRAWLVLRRPPVLAFASVAVLLGGALVVSNRADDVQVMATADDPAQPAERAPMRAAGSSGGAVTTVEVDPTSAPPEAATEQGSRVDGAGAMAAPIVAADPSPAEPRARPAAAKPSRPRAFATEVSGESASLGQRLDADELDEAPAGKDSASAEATLATDSVEATAAGPDDRGLRATDKLVRPGLGRKRPPPIHGEPQPAPPPASGTLDTLIAQCDAAAERGDCARVKVLAKEIQARDEASYRRRVLSRPAIARCLAR